MEYTNHGQTSFEGVEDQLIGNRLSLIYSLRLESYPPMHDIQDEKCLVFAEEIIDVVTENFQGKRRQP